MPRFPLVIHATHEAGVKLGGIGAVLDGLLASPAYNEAVARTILVGPVNVHNHVEMERLTAPGNGLTIQYSSIHGINQASESLVGALQDIERSMHVRLLYGKRRFGPAEHEVILVDAQGIAGDAINGFKFYVWEKWHLSSAHYQSQWEFSFYMDAAEPLFAALQAVSAGSSANGKPIIIAHEWLGLPVVFSALLHAPSQYCTIFYAHEVATARWLVEEHDGHDTRFYNALRAGLAQGHFMDDVFGDLSGFFKHGMIQRAGICDGIFAVGDLIVDELRFLGGVFRDAHVDLVYNGVPPHAPDLERKMASRHLMLQYAENLLGFRPDYVFTHVTRMVLSKALWRDIRVLEHLDRMLASRGQRAVLFTVSTADPTGRRSEDVHRWEQEYGWPVGHRGDNGDLRGGEAEYFFHVLEPFNWSSRAITGVLINQFGWSREACGTRMPAEMSFLDLRTGTDLEFGQSIYEPFGIAQIEPLAAGTLSVVSNVCGCVGLVRRTVSQQDFPAFIVADYVSLPDYWVVGSPWDALWIDRRVRDGIEAHNSFLVAEQIAQRLPADNQEIQSLLARGQEISHQMTWDVIVRNYLLPSLARAEQR